MLTTGNKELLRSMWQLLLTYSLPILTTALLQKAHGKHQSKQHLQMRHLSVFCPVILNSENTFYSENQMHLYTVLITPAVSFKTSLVCWRTRHTRLITSVRVGKETTDPKFASTDHLNTTWTSSFGWFMWKLVTTALERTQHYTACLTAYTHAHQDSPALQLLEDQSHK